MNTRFYMVRKASNLTQSEFGSRIGVTTTAISKIESGTRQPSEMVIRAVCEKFNINRHWLETGEGDMVNPQANNDLDAIMSIMHGQSESKKRLVRLIASMPDDLLSVFMKFFDEYNKKDQ